VKDYSGFIVAAYGFATLVIGYLIVKIAVDYRDLKKKLAKFGGREETP
jgi:heme exporter protein CcmD